MKIAILNDTHCGARNSSPIFIDYQERFYETIFFPYLIANDIKRILHLGDYFEHRKYVNFMAYSANRNHFLKRLKELDIEMDIIPGNHDVYFRNTLELNSLDTQLGEFIESGHVRVHTKPTTIDYAGVKFDLIPWLTPLSEPDAMKFLDESKSHYVGGHFEFKGFEMNPGQYCTDGMDIQWTKKFMGVFSGHFHTKNSQQNVHYLGSQFEFTWADVNDKKYFHTFDTVTHELKPIRNPITLFTKLIYDDRIYDYNHFDTTLVERKYVKVIVPAGGKTNQSMFDALIDRITATGVQDLKISETHIELGEEIAQDVNFEDTVSLAHSYIDGIETSLDKSKLKQMMTDLYHQATAAED